MINEHVPDGTFVKEVAALAQPQIQKLTRGQYAFMAGDKLQLVGEQLLAEPVTLDVSTLDAVVQAYVGFGEDDMPCMVQVVSPAEVRLIDPSVGEEKQQFIYVRAKAQTPELSLGRYLPMDQFIIQLQTLFGVTEDRRRVLQFVGGMTAGLAAEIADDGVSQSVTTRKGLTRAGEPVKFDNPVLLEPFRTFSEVEQPISAFVLRLQQQKSGEEYSANAALIEADGGAWRREAIASIGAWLRERLPEATILA
jgi:hypothetical protein